MVTGVEQLEVLSTARAAVESIEAVPSAPAGPERARWWDGYVVVAVAVVGLLPLLVAVATGPR